MSKVEKMVSVPFRLLESMTMQLRMLHVTTHGKDCEKNDILGDTCPIGDAVREAKAILAARAALAALAAQRRKR